MGYVGNHVEPDPDYSLLSVGHFDKFAREIAPTVTGRYLEAMYFSLSAMAMGGFGDYVPQNTLEQCLAMGMSLVNYCTLVYAIGATTSVVSALDAPTRAFQAHFVALETYLQTHQLPRELGDELRVFAMLRYEAREEHLEMIERFPPIVRARILRLLYRPVISHCYVLAGVTDAFIESLSGELSLAVFQDGISVVTQGDSGQELFFVASGLLHALLKSRAPLNGGPSGVQGEEDPDTEDSQAASAAGAAAGAVTVRVGELGDNESFGEVAFLFNLAQPYSVVTARVVRLLILKKAGWERLLASDTAHNRFAVEENAFECAPPRAAARAPTRAGVPAATPLAAQQRWCGEIQGRDSLLL